MRSLRIQFVIISAFFSLVGMGQTNYVKPMQDMTPKTPEAASLSKFIDIPPGNYTGSASVSVPVYTIESNGLSFPISLDYHVLGVRVGETSSRVGLGWALNVGNASLSKQTVGYNDSLGFSTYNSAFFHPLYYYLHDETDPDNDYIVAKEANGLMANEIYDTQPDIYSYSIGGTSGKFINVDGIRKISETSIKIQIGGGYTFTDTNGTKYIFSKNGYQNTAGPEGSQPDTNNYKLDYIEFINGERIEFHYRMVQYNYLINRSESETIDLLTTNCPGDVEVVHNSSNYADNQENVLMDIVFPNGKVIFSYSDEKTTPEYREDILNDVYCNAIRVEDLNQTVIRNFQLNQSYFYSGDYSPHSTSGGFAIFYEKMRKGLYYRLKLNSTKELISGAEYSFEYNEAETLPNRLSFDSDYWGFYNGAGNIEDIPKTLYENRFYGSADKSPNLNYATAGSLKKVTFPTGGTEEITYEQDDYFFEGIEHEYEYKEFEIDTQINETFDEYYPFTLDGDVDQRLEFESTPNALGSCTNCIPLLNSTYIFGAVYDENHDEVTKIYTNVKNKVVIPAGSYYLRINKVGNGTFHGKLKLSWYKASIDTVSTNKKIGSLRVSKIKLDSGNGSSITKKYAYTVPNSTHSSGLNHGDIIRPYSTIKGIGDAPCTTCEKVVLGNNSGINLSSVNGKSVGYDYVSEIYADEADPTNNFSTLYKYTNIPDAGIQDYRISPFVPREDESFKRGLLLEKSEIDKSGQIKRKEINQYDYDLHFNVLRPMNFAQSSAASPIKVDAIKTQCGYEVFLWKDYRIPSAWVKQTQKQTIEFFPTGNITTTEDYTYSPTYAHLFPVDITTTYTNGDITKVSHKYPPDIPLQAGMHELISEHRIGMPIETTVTKNAAVLSREKTIYADNAGTGSLTMPVAIYAAKFPNSLPSISTEIGTLERRATFDKYVNGKVCQFMPENGMSTVLIWGYNNSYPIAKIENATASQVMSALGVSDLSLVDESDLGDINNLRSNTALADAMITTYTYIPLVGVSTIKDPKGYTVSYIYDDFGRLKAVKDAQGNILSENEYHYKSQN